MSVFHGVHGRTPTGPVQSDQEKRRKTAMLLLINSSPRRGHVTHFAVNPKDPHARRRRDINFLKTHIQTRNCLGRRAKLSLRPGSRRQRATARSARQATDQSARQEGAHAHCYFFAAAGFFAANSTESFCPSASCSGFRRLARRSRCSHATEWPLAAARLNHM